MKEILKDMLRPMYYLLSSPNYRTYQYMLFRHGNTKRYSETRVEFAGRRFIVPDVPSFLHQYREIFVEGVYRFSSTSASPLIVDCGANVGLSCTFFSESYPAATIMAFEADPHVFRLLEQNITSNNVKNVKLFNKAVWIHNDGVSFEQEGADGGAVVSGSSSTLNIPSIRLKDLLRNHPVDFLKIDIEGAEYEVLLDCAHELQTVKTIFFEYHSFRHHPQRLQAILEVLAGAGFRYYIQSSSLLHSPLLKIAQETNPLDLQLNVFCYKHEK